MIELIIKLLGPFFYGLGVSEADFNTYLTSLQGYIYAILIALVVMIVVLIAAHWVKKGKRHLVRWNAVLCFIALVAVLVNVICYGPMYTNVSGFLNAAKVDLSDTTVAQSKDTIQEVGEEGFVLLKNDNSTLPLSEDTKKLNVFGWASTNPLYGGTGSGSSDSSSAISILQSLKDAGYETNSELTDMYTEYCAERPSIAMAAQDWTLPEPTAEYYTDSLMSDAKKFSDTAVVVIGRSGGEGADLPTDMNAVIHGTYNVASEVSVSEDNYGYTNGTYTNNGDYDDFDAGESYLELSNTEEAMLNTVCSNFDKVIVVINANNAMELNWVDNYSQIGAVIYAPGAGATGFEALGEIINGSVNPSGKTADTFVKDLFNTPTSNNMGNYAYTNVDDLKEAIAAEDAAYEGNIGFVNYVEGIYVGYKFYETASDDGAINYEDYVQYPFGYGLSYTTFSEEMQNFKDNGDSVSFDVVVTNTGSVAGKDAVEIYFTPPYTNGGIEKASVNLIDFAKTGELEPGAAETVSFTINKEDLASYDSEGIKIAGGGYILEAGDYTISVREDSHTVLDQATFTVDSDIDYSQTGRSTDETVATNQFEDYSRGDFTQLSRADQFANYTEATAAPSEEDYVMDDETRAAVEANSVVGYDNSQYEDDATEMPTQGEDGDLSVLDMVGVDYDDPSWETLLNEMTVDEMVQLVNVGGWQTVAVDSIGLVATSDCDGPAGLNNFITGAYGTAYPAEVLMAQTWNKDLLREVGESISQEYKEAGNYGWYGPAMNIHRTAFAGRNFEYFSEDSILSAYLAAEEINGAAENGLYPYVKHFALNDQETNRCSFLMTYASEQAIREIYLKPFEEAIKNYEGTSLAVMSAFNWIGTEPCCGNDNLLKSVLRDEWGFTGLVETDYDGSYGYMITENCIHSGNDLMLGFGTADTNKVDTESASNVVALRQASKDIIYTIANSGYYADGDPTGGISNMTKIFVTVDVMIAVLIIAAETVLILRYRKQKQA